MYMGNETGLSSILLDNHTQDGRLVAISDFGRHKSDFHVSTTVHNFYSDWLSYFGDNFQANSPNLYTTFKQIVMVKFNQNLESKSTAPLNT